MKYVSFKPFKALVGFSLWEASLRLIDWVVTVGNNITDSLYVTRRGNVFLAFQVEAASSDIL